MIEGEPIPKKKIVVVDEDDIVEVPRKTQKRDEDDEDYDRPRRNKKSRRYADDEDDDEEDWQAKPRSKKGHGNARVGMLLLTISSWLYFSLYVLFTLCVFLMLVSYLFAVENPGVRAQTTSRSNLNSIMSAVNAVLVLIGLIGIGNWVVSLVGFSFCIAGPPRTRTTAITTTSIAGVHLLLVGLSYAIPSHMIISISQLGMQSSSWLIFATTLPFLDSFLPTLVYSSRNIDGEYLVIILAGVCEVVRLIFSLITIRSVAAEAKDYQAAERAQLGIVATSIIVGGGLILMLLVCVMINEADFSNLKAIIGLGLGTFFILCVAYTAMLLVPALTAGSTRSSLSRRNR